MVLSHTIGAVELSFQRVRESLFAIRDILSSQGIQYSVVGGIAVESWLAAVLNEEPVYCRDINLLIRRSNLARIQLLIDSLKLKTRVTFLFEGEFVKPNNILPAPPIQMILSVDKVPILALNRLVEMKLVAHRDIDFVHIDDLIKAGLIDQTWTSEFHPILADRLQYMLDNPQPWH